MGHQPLFPSGILEIDIENDFATKTGLLFNNFHLLWYESFWVSSWQRSCLFNLLIMDVNSVHLNWTPQVETPPIVLSMTKTSNKNFFHYAGYPLLTFIQVKALWIEIESFIFSLKTLIRIRAANLFDAIFLIAILIWQLNLIFEWLSEQLEAKFYSWKQIKFFIY